MSAKLDMQPLSVGILVGSVSRLAGGLFNSVRRSAWALRDQGVDVTIYSIEDEHSAEDLAAWAPLTPRVFPRRYLNALGYGQGLKEAVLAGGHDVLHLHGIWQYNSHIANLWRAKTGGKVMISPRGMLDPWALSHSAWKKKIVSRLFENKNLKGSTCLHALNASEAQSMRDYGLTQEIAIIPNGADIPDPSIKPALPEWKKGDRKTLLFLGRLHEKKGLDPLIEAWASLLKSQPKLSETWQLAIAGWDDGGYETGLREKVTALGLDEEITFTGPVFGDVKASTLFHSNAFILPSHSEGLPMSILEAWSYSLPVFMTDACNIPSGFTSGAAVKITPDAGSIETALGTHLGKSAELADMGKKGRALVESDFVWSSIGQKHRDAYEAMLGRREWPDFVKQGGS